jgi:hypothetical protein
MNHTAIELSNRGVEELRRGDAVSAFQSLSQSANIAMMLIENHHDDVSTEAHVFQFHWVDFSVEVGDVRKRPSSQEGCASFLFHRALKVSTTCSEGEVDRLCPCGFAWVVWFNLALSCSVLGTRLGERGKLFLEMAHDLYQKVQRRVDSEHPSRHWQILAMAVSNNQACIFYDFSMQHAAGECLQRLAVTLSVCNTESVTVEDRGDFFLNLQIMGSQTIAAAA